MGESCRFVGVIIEVLLEGKKGLVMGVAGHRSIATAVACHAIHNQAEVVATYLADDSGKAKQRAEKGLEQQSLANLLACDATNTLSIQSVISEIKEYWGKIDFLVHSIAWAPIAELRQPVLQCSRQGFLDAMNASVYSLIEVLREANEILAPGGSVVTMTYLGSQKVVPGYNTMGIAKAGLEAATRYLSYDLGKQDIRVNAVSAGPLKTLASSAIPSFQEMQQMAQEKSPLNHPLEHQDVAKAVTYLLSDYASGVTGEIHHVDCGYNVMA